VQKKVSKKLLGIYDLILALGAIYIGVKMVNSNSRIFIEYPKEWLSKVPFESWVIPGIIAIVLFGIGNIIAAIVSLRGKSNRSWFLSTIMGGILLMSIVCQVIILGEWYMVTIQIFIFSIIQLCLSRCAFTGIKKSVK